MTSGTSCGCGLGEIAGDRLGGGARGGRAGDGAVKLGTGDVVGLVVGLVEKFVGGGGGGGVD